MVPSSSSLLVTVAALQGVRAWGSLGHATVAYIAQNYVTAETAAWAQDLLNDTSDSYPANVASWADSYRATTAGSWSAPLHFIDAEDNPPTSCNVDYDRDCGSSGCSVSAIVNYTQRVGDGRLSTANTAQALKFLVHFIGDITQPLHDEAYELGANGVAVTYEGYSDNLHSDWDTYMPETLIGGSSLTYAQSWAKDLITEIESGNYSSVAASWIAGDSVSSALDTAMAWASDANTFVCSVVMPNGAAALTAMTDLYPTYYESVIPTIELQIAKGGYRLGNWLNLIYTKEIAAKRSVGEVDGSSLKKAVRESMPDLEARDFLPAPRPMSRAQKARAESGYKCNHSRRDGHDHEHHH